MLPIAVVDERDSPWFHWLFILKNGCIPTSHGGPEIKYLLQGEMSENGCLLDNEIPHQNGELWSGIHQVGSVVL